jgi:hypothetical protein
VAIEYAPGGQPSTRQACTIRSFGTSSNWRPPMCPPKSANAPPTSLLIWVGVLSRGMDFIASRKCMILSNCLAPIYLAFETVFLAMVSVLERSLSPNGSSRRATAQGIAALSIGGMIVARTMVDRTLADELRTACMTVALELGGWDERSRSKAVHARQSKLCRTAAIP